MNTKTQRPPRVAKLADPRVALVAVNVSLMLVLGVVTLAPTADAQQSQRPRGEYIVLGGQMTGAPTSAVHVIDTSNQEMVTLRWDQSKKEFEGIGFRNLRIDAQGNRGGGR